MTDIIERLRDAKRIAKGWKSYEPNPLCQEAATEIERLRADLDHWKTVACDCLDTRDPPAPSPSHQTPAENTGDGQS